MKKHLQIFLSVLGLILMITQANAQDSNLVFDFNEDGVTEGWSVTDLTVANGTAQIPYGGSGATFFANYDSIADLAIYGSAEIIVKNPTDAEVFFRVRRQKLADSANDWIIYTFTQSNNDTEFQTYTIDLTTDARFLSTDHHPGATAIQIGIRNGTIAGTVEVDKVSLIAAQVTTSGLEFTWNTDGDAESWEGTGLTVAGGSAVIPYSGSGTYWFSNYNVDFEPSQYNQAEIKVKNPTDAEVIFRVRRFKSDESNDWIVYTFDQTNADTEVKTYVLDLTSDARYLDTENHLAGANTIQMGFRNGTTSGSIEVDNVKLMSTATESSQVIVFGSLDAVTVGDAEFELTATASSELAVTYTSSNTDVATISGSTVTIVAAGSTDITASQAGDDTWDAATDVVQTLVVREAGFQAISFPPLPNAILGSDPIELAATASSGLDVTYTSSNAEVATISGSTVTIVGLGTTDITASQAGDGTWNAAIDVVQTLTVINSLPHVIYDFENDVQGWGAVNTAHDASRTWEVLTSVNGVLICTSLEAGQWQGIISPTGLGLDASVYDRIMIVMDQPTAATKLQILNYDVNSPGLITPAVKPQTEIEMHVDIRTLFFDMPGAPAANEGIINQIGMRPAAGTPDSLEWKIDQIVFLSNSSTTQFIAFNMLDSIDEGAAPIELVATTSAGLPVSFSSDNAEVATVEGNILTIVSPGTVNITASQAGDGAFEAAADVVKTLVVNEVAGGAQTITFDALPDYSIPAGQYVELMATSSSGLPVTFTSSDETVAVIEGNLLTVIGDGSVEITASQDGDVNWDAATPIVQTLTTTPLEDLVWDFNTDGDILWEGNGLTVAGGVAVLPVDATGAYFFSEYDTLFNSSFYHSVEITMKNPGSSPIFFRFRADATSSWTQISMPDALNDTEFETHTIDLSANSNYIGPINALQLRINDGTVGNIEVDNIKMVAIATGGPQTIKFEELSDVSIVGESLQLEATATSNLPVSFSGDNDEVATVSETGLVTFVTAGTLNITASQEGGGDWDAAEDVVRSLTILPEGVAPDIEFTFNSGEEGFEWNFGNNAMSSVIAADGVVTLTWNGDGLALPYFLKNLDEPFQADNYQLAEIVLKNNSTGDVKIRTRNTRDSGAERFLLHEFDQSHNDTEFHTYIFPLVGEKYEGLTIDHIQINPPSDLVGTFSVEIDNLRLMAQGSTAQTISFDEPASADILDGDFSLTGTASSGLPLTYVSSDTSVATVRAGVVTPVGLGTTEVTAYQYGNGTFAQATPVTQSLEITSSQTAQTITFESIESKTFGDATFTLGASTTSNLDITYTSSNQAVAMISGNSVTIVGAGTADITASQEGNNDFLPAESITQTLTVAKADQTITFNAIDPVNVGDANFSLSATISSGLVIKYASSNSDVATVLGKNVTIVGAGTTEITASHDGNSNYNAATAVSQTLTVNDGSTVLSSTSDFSITIYPNPTQDELFISNSNQWDGATATILSLSGSKVLEVRLRDIDLISVNDLSPGQYILKLTLGDKKESLTFIKN